MSKTNLNIGNKTEAIFQQTIISILKIYNVIIRTLEICLLCTKAAYFFLVYRNLSKSSFLLSVKYKKNFYCWHFIKWSDVYLYLFYIEPSGKRQLLFLLNLQTGRGEAEAFWTSFLWKKKLKKMAKTEERKADLQCQLNFSDEKTWKGS